MKTLEKYLDAAKEKTGSDYRTAQMLGLTRQQISNARTRGHLGPDQVAKMADLLGISPFQILSEINAERTEDPVMKARWEKWGKEASRWVAGVAILGTLGLFATFPDDVFASQNKELRHIPQLNILYIMRGFGT